MSVIGNPSGNDDLFLRLFAACFRLTSLPSDDREFPLVCRGGNGGGSLYRKLPSVLALRFPLPETIRSKVCLQVHY